MSTVATLSTWLILTNRSRSRSRNGSWTHRYEHGVPTTGLHTIAEQRHVRDHRPVPPGRVTAYGESSADSRPIVVALTWRLSLKQQIRR